jgi:hypothetical protein
MSSSGAAKVLPPPPIGDRSAIPQNVAAAALPRMRDGCGVSPQATPGRSTQTEPEPGRLCHVLLKGTDLREWPKKAPKAEESIGGMLVSAVAVLLRGSAAALVQSDEGADGLV